MSPVPLLLRSLLAHPPVALLLLALLPVGPACAQELVFQPGFHQGLRRSVDSGRATYRMRVPVGRAGSRLRVSFRAGDRDLQLYAATVALAGSEGSLASTPLTLTFGGAPQALLSRRERRTSDAVPLPVGAGTELAVSFEVEGALAASEMDAFPGSFVRSGSHTGEQGPLGGSHAPRAVGLDTIDVEGPPGRAFVAIGDSITEGFVTWAGNDFRESWPAVAQARLGVPVVAAAAYGQQVQDAQDALAAEVLTLEGITDCIVLLGTNNLGRDFAPTLISRLESLYADLRPFCRVWGTTLPPKEEGAALPLEEVVSARRAVNAWILGEAQLEGRLDLGAVLAEASAPDRFAPGLGMDGVHPSVAGQQRMGEEAARVLAEQVLPAPLPSPILRSLVPAVGSPSGGTRVALRGEGFTAESRVLFGERAASWMELVSDTELWVEAPPHSSGTVSVTVLQPDGRHATLPGAFSYQPPSSEGDTGGEPGAEQPLVLPPPGGVGPGDAAGAGAVSVQSGCAATAGGPPLTLLLLALLGVRPRR